MSGQLICEICGAVGESDARDGWEVISYDEDGRPVRLCPSCSEDVRRRVTEDR